MNMASRIDWAMGEGRERSRRRTEEEKRGQTKTGRSRSGAKNAVERTKRTRSQNAWVV